MNPVDSSTRIVSRTDKEFKVTDQNSKVFMPETDVDSVYFSDYEHNQIKSYKNGKVGLYRKGVKFMNFKYDKIKPDLNDSYIVTKSGKEGVINSKGKIVVPIMYDAVFPDFDYDYS